MTSPDDILMGLATLSPDKLQEAQARIAALRGTQRGAESTKTQTDHQMVYDQLTDLLRSRTGERPAPWPVFIKSKYGASFKAGADLLLDYVRQHLQPKTKTETSHMVRFLLGLIIKNVLTYGRAPLSAGSAARRMQRVAGIVEDSFPGYLASGLLPKVIKVRNAA